ncbi:hypothetical protein [Salipiger sp. PrR003]|uniref:hypothetical protein n=1 Tax=Salipiger sp. PrR003 TaxID=2706776 RepID=UPI0013D96F46|nr:hypothetical protein [Salipiger sp. PrR003]NDV52941.1 hypothetical protein [Salipiger sp. PrR003]
MENPGALAGATGADSKTTHGNAHANNTKKSARSAMSLFGKDSHKRVSKAIGYALTLATESAWESFSKVLAARLTYEERAALAFAALRSLDEDTAYLTASAAVFDTMTKEARA